MCHTSRGSHGTCVMQSRVTALVNDAVASFAACRYTDSDTMLGVILGTGVNGAYVEQAQRVQNAGKQLPADAHVIINCEWAEFVTEALPQIHADRELDTDTINTGDQHFEKMTAGETCGCCCYTPALVHDAWGASVAHHWGAVAKHNCSSVRTQSSSGLSITPASHPSANSKLEHA